MRRLYYGYRRKNMIFQKFKRYDPKISGMQVGFSEQTPSIHIAQYESGSRTPKPELTKNLAKVFGVSTRALTIPDIDSYNGLMHTLFTLEDLYGFRIDKLDDELCIRLDKGMGTNYLTMFEKNTITRDITTPKA